MNRKEKINKILWWIPSKKIRNSIREIINDYEEEINKLNIEVFNNINHAIKRTTPQAYLKSIDIHLADHCNLNCFSCFHFSQIAEESYYDINIFEKDIERLSKITNGLVETFNLMGGEPLLNKNCKNYFYTIRKYFNKSKILLVTNGILLLKQDKEFWISCKENDIIIQPTVYPIKIDWENIKLKASEYNVTLSISNNELNKTSYKVVLDLEGGANIFNSFRYCGFGNDCVQLKNGRLYTCQTAAYINFFNKKYNQNLKLTEYDYIDIYQDYSYEDILLKLAKPIPFCKYCDVSKWKNMGVYKSTTNSIEDYIELID